MNSPVAEERLSPPLTSNAGQGSPQPPKLPGLSQTLLLLESLRTAARDFATKAAKLNEDFKLRTSRSDYKRKTTLEELEKKLQADLAQEQANFQTACELGKANYERRKARLGKAYRTSKELGLSRVEEQIGKKKYGLQRKMLQAEKDHETGLKETTRALEEYRTALAAEQQALQTLEWRAAKSFKGYGGFMKLLSPVQHTSGQPDDPSTLNEHKLLDQLRSELANAEAALSKFRKRLLIRVLRYPLLWAILLACALGLVPLLKQLGQATLDLQKAGIGLVAVMVLILFIRFIVQNAARSSAKSTSDSITHAHQLAEQGATRAETHYTQEVERIEREFKQTSVESDHGLKRALSEGTELRGRSRNQTDEKTFRITARHDELYRLRQERRQQQHAQTLERLKSEAEASRRALDDSADTNSQKWKADYDRQWQALEIEWRTRVEPLFRRVKEAKATSDKLFPAWDTISPATWLAPAHFAHAAKMGDCRVDLEKLCEPPPGTELSPVESAAEFSLPLCLVYPDQGSLVFETGNQGREEAIASLNNLVLRLLSVAPPGRLNFTIIDPVGLGQNFAGVMHLADYEEQLINSRIWTQSGQIEQRLADLNEHMEKVIQMYLRNEYATIAEYNEQAGVIAEKYQFLVVADFPVNFSDVAARRLLSIASSGARCGVYLLLHWDQRHPLPADFVPEELRKNAVRITCRGNEFLLAGKAEPGLSLSLEAPPPPEQAIRFIQTIGQTSKDSSRVEVPFSQITPKPDEIWSEETTNELRVPIGRTGATKLQYLEIGKGTRQHGLIAGKTGSGKSTLFHVVITNLALWCSPEQVEFYLVDFKKGVEFKCYAAQRLPHARVVAIESDREFGLSVLQKVDEELKRRGDLFRKLGVQDVPGYKRAGGTEPIPRSLLLIDEFQEFFVEDDKIAQTASLLLDRIVRQGRAFGIHVLLGSQTLGGAYTVARTTLGQMVIRIALQCNEADAYLIMDDNNPAPRLLSRPGEGIYNDTAGTLEGNSPFQVVWLPEAERDSSLAQVRKRAEQNGANYPGPFVFEGNAPAEVVENNLLRRLLDSTVVQKTTAARIWLGAPNSIKGPTEAVFYRQSGNNLLMVGQREEAILAMLSVGLLGLAAQFPVGAARFIVADAAPPGTPPREFLENVLKVSPHKITLAKPGDVPQLLKEFVGEMKKRAEDPNADDAAPVFLFINGLQRFNKLRYEEDFSFSSGGSEETVNPSALLNTLITEGTRLGFHVIAACDTYNNVTRFLSRKALTEFEMRVLFQMSANDSASLIDNPKASLLGLHRALYYNEQQGYLETFRPYALPGNEWIEEAGRKLRRLLSPGH